LSKSSFSWAARGHDRGRVGHPLGASTGYAATRAHLGIVAVLFALAAIGWWWTVGEMRGMGNGRWTALGGGRVPHGTGNGAWSAGCCWALMASLFRAGRDERDLEGRGHRG
jgi:hypothetical protein